MFVVIKYGGSALGDEKHLKKRLPKLCQIIEKHIHQGKKVILISSALTGETRKLRKLGRDIFTPPFFSSKTQDSLLANGEEKATSLLEGYFTYQTPFSCASLMRSKLPIITDKNYGSANIEEVKTNDILTCLEKNDICLIPGFIGRTTEGDTTTLGFDGSDISATMIATSLNTDVCLFYKDVPGVLTANPRRVPKSRKIDKISYETMFVFSLLGARVIHPKAIEIAKRKNVSLHILSTFFTKDNGTFISNKKESEADVIGITYYQQTKTSISVSIVGKKIGSSKDVLELLNQHDIEHTFLNLYPKLNISFQIKDLSLLDKTLKVLHSYYDLDASKNSHLFDDTNKDKALDPSLNLE